MKKVYAYIGVIGSGKDFNAKAKAEELDCKIFDFSDGVRDFTWGFLGYKPANESDYIEFKRSKNCLVFNCNDFKKDMCITGRKFLENVGFMMRSYDKNFWVNYCVRNAEKYVDSTDNNVVFNAVRYINEAAGVRQLAAVQGYELHFIFCNYRSERYEIRNDDSELFAQKILMQGFPHGTDITDFVIEMIREDFRENNVAKK